MSLFSHLEQKVSKNVLQTYIMPHFYKLSFQKCIQNYPHLEIILNHPKYNLNDALCWTSRSGNLKYVKYFIEHGAEIHFGRESPILYASWYGQLDVVIYLVSLGADYRVNNCEPVIKAIKHGHLHVVFYLLDQGDNSWLVYFYLGQYASRHGYINVIRYIQRNTPYFNEYEEWLLVASQYGHLELVKFLCNNYGYKRRRIDSAVVKASRKGNLDVVKYLVEVHGANKETALYGANIRHQFDVVHYLEDL